MEKSLFLIILLFSISALAEVGRSPAVLSGSCNLDIPTMVEIEVKGKKIKKDRSIQEVQEEQCQEVKKCLNSAGEDEVDDLKKLEEVACKNVIATITTQVPATVVDKNYDGKRDEKSPAELDKTIKPLEKSATAR